jgi:hypothetical protein
MLRIASNAGRRWSLSASIVSGHFVVLPLSSPNEMSAS